MADFGTFCLMDWIGRVLRREFWIFTSWSNCCPQNGVFDVNWETDKLPWHWQSFDDLQCVYSSWETDWWTPSMRETLMIHIDSPSIFLRYSTHSSWETETRHPSFPTRPAAWRGSPWGAVGLTFTEIWASKRPCRWYLQFRFLKWPTYIYLIIYVCLYVCRKVGR